MAKVTEMNSNDNLLAGIAAVEAKESIPAGYTPIRLSTKGMVGAPALFHIRNFSTRDIMALALTGDEELPERLVELLEELIYEDVDVMQFHEAEVIETMVRLYASFFSAQLEINFPVEESDLEYIQKEFPDSYQDKLEALRTGKWVPKTTINLITDVSSYDIESTFKSTARIRSHDTDFSAGFGLPRYGDVITIKKWIADSYGEKEKRFATVKKLIQLRDGMIERYEAGEDVDLSRLPFVDPDAEHEYLALQEKKAVELVDVIRALHLVSFEGKDVKNKSLEERVALVQDPRVDVTVAKKLNEYFDNLHFGLQPEVRMLNPLTGKHCTRRYSFRLLDLLQAVQLSKTDEYDIVFGDEC